MVTMSSSVMSERFENVGDDGRGGSRKERKFFNSFVEKRNLEATCVLIRTRSENAKPQRKKKSADSVWDQKPVDLTWKLYHPHPPKRNTREAIKPWEYDKYLRKTEENVEPASAAAKSKDPMDKTSLMSNLFKSSLSTETAESSDSSDNQEFKVDVRVDTPGGARFKAAREMGFREGLDTYRIPKPHDFRGLKFLYGMPEFKTRFEKDPYDIKFLTENLPQIHGLPKSVPLRDVDPTHQMGDLVKKADPHYDPDLILPTLPFPNRFYGYTRHRPLVRSVTSAFWDRALPKLAEKWEAQKLQNTFNKRSSPPPSSPAPSPASSTSSLVSTSADTLSI